MRNRIRDIYVKTHPFCELFFEKGVIVPVEEVHYKVPLAEGGTHDRSNLISLCKSCHAQIPKCGDCWNKEREHSYYSEGLAARKRKIFLFIFVLTSVQVVKVGVVKISKMK